MEIELMICLGGGIRGIYFMFLGEMDVIGWVKRKR